jgi:hypothetical protein
MPTASSFGMVMTPTKQQKSGSQERYIAQLLADITCLSPKYFTNQGGPVNAATEYGRITEAKARRFYESERGVTVRQVGFCKTDDGRFGCSPDGLIDPDGCLELKCPERQTHMYYLLKGVLPNDYRCQVHGQLIVTGRKWVDFLSYCEQEKPLLIRVIPDSFTMALRTHLEMFSTKFEAAKKHFRIQPQDQSEDTPEIIQAVANWNGDLTQVANNVASGDWTEQRAVEEINKWLPDLKKYDLPKKQRVYGVLRAWIEKRPVPYYLDKVNLIYRLEKDVEF